MHHTIKNTKPLTLGKTILFSVASLAIFIMVAIICEILTSWIKLGTLKIAIRELVLRIPLTIFSLHIFAKKVIKQYDPVGMYGRTVLVTMAKWIAVGLFLPIILWLIYYLFQVVILYKKTTIMPFSDQVGLFIKWFSISLAAGITEEVLFRGHLFMIITNRCKIYGAVVITSLIFGLVHIVMLTSFQIVDILIVVLGGWLAGLMFSMIYLQTKVIWYAAVVHVLWDIFFIGKIMTVATTQTDANNAILAFKLTTHSLILTGGNFGMEAALPCLMAYVIVFLCLYNKATLRR